MWASGLSGVVTWAMFTGRDFARLLVRPFMLPGTLIWVFSLGMLVVASVMVWERQGYADLIDRYAEELHRLQKSNGAD
jgi:hypothetical protein